MRDVLMAARSQSELDLKGDWDVATDALPEQVIRLFRRTIPTGLQHGTVTVMMGRDGVEVTTLRGESTYSDGRRPDAVTFVDDIVADLARRDFTINAIAYDPVRDLLSDPFDGLSDLERRCLRAVGDPAQRFAEDGLRVLRAARFHATLEVDIEPATARAMAPSLASYRCVSAERIRDEWQKALKARRPSRALQAMLDHGMLAITAPELVAMNGCDQNRHHAYDVWNHTLRVLDDVAQDRPALRLAALLHDIGKPMTRDVHPTTGDFTFYNHEHAGAPLADDLLRRLRFSNEQRHHATSLVRHHIVVYDAAWTDAAVRRWIRRVSKELVGDVIALCRSDVRGKGRPVDDELARIDQLEMHVGRILEQGAALSLKDLAINGRDLMQDCGASPGPLLGQILTALLEEVVENPEHNERERLLARARELISLGPQ